MIDDRTDFAAQSTAAIPIAAIFTAYIANTHG